MRWKKTLAALVAISISGLAYAGQLTPGTDTTTFTSGTNISSSEVNTNFNNIINDGVNDNATDINNLTNRVVVLEPQVITVASSNIVPITINSFHTITGNTEIKNFVVAANAAPEAGSKFTVKFQNNIVLAHDDSSVQAAGRLSLLGSADTEYLAGDIVEFISDGTILYEIPQAPRDFIFGNIDPDPNSIKSMHTMTTIASRDDGYIDNFRLESPYHARTTAITSRWAIDGEKVYCTAAGWPTTRTETGWNLNTAKPWKECPATNESGTISFPATLKTKTTALNLDHTNATASEAHALAIQLWSAGDTDPNGVHLNLWLGGGSQTGGDEGPNIMRLTVDDSTHTPSGYTVVPATVSGLDPATLVTLNVVNSGGGDAVMGETATKGVGEGRLIVFKPSGGYITSTGNTIQPPGTTSGGAPYAIDQTEPIPQDRLPYAQGSFPPLRGQSGGYGGHDGWWYITGADPTGWASVEVGWCVKDDLSDYTPAVAYVPLDGSLGYEDSAQWLYIRDVGTWDDNGTTRPRFRTEWFSQSRDYHYPSGTLWGGNYTFAPCAHVVNPIYSDTNPSQVTSIEVFKETSWSSSSGVVEFYVPSYGDMPFQGITLTFNSKLGSGNNGTGLELIQLLGNSGPGTVQPTRSGRYAMGTGLRMTTSGGAYNGEIQVINNSLKDGKYHPWDRGVECDLGACRIGIDYDYYDYHQTSGSTVISITPPDNPAKAFGGAQNCGNGGLDVPGGAPAGGGSWGTGDGLLEACWGNGYGTSNYMNVVDVEGHTELDLRLTRVGWGTGRGYFPVIGKSVSAVAPGAAKDGQAVVWDDTNQYHEYAPILDLTALETGIQSDYVIKWNGANWTAAPDAGGLGSTTVAGMSDTTIASPSAGEVLLYNDDTNTWKNEKSLVPRQTFAGSSGVTQPSTYATAVVYDVSLAPAETGFGRKHKVTFNNLYHNTNGNFQKIGIELSSDGGANWINSGLYYNFITQKANGLFTGSAGFGSNATQVYIQTEGSGQSITGVKELTFEIDQAYSGGSPTGIKVDGLLTMLIGGNQQLARVTGFINTTGTTVITNDVTNIRLSFGTQAPGSPDQSVISSLWTLETYLID